MFLGSRTYSPMGLFLYNRSTKVYYKVTAKVISGKYSVSPNGQVLISSLGTNGLLVIKLDRLFKPLLIDKIRRQLGVVSL